MARSLRRVRSSTTPGLSGDRLMFDAAVLLRAASAVEHLHEFSNGPGAAVEVG